MPRTESVISVFISSPSDVSEEREILESVINELNGTWSRTLGLRFEPVMWETHSRPGFGIDPQDVLNQQLPDDYDVFIGILWGRIGTPTPRSESGTLEEFERALNRHNKGDSSIDIMVYFKDAGIPPSKSNPEQLSQVQKFKTSLGEKGGLYSIFEDSPSFESSIRAHLSSLAQKFSDINLSNNSKKINTNNNNELSPPRITTDESLEEPLKEDLGFWDYTDIYESQISELSSTLNTISKATVKIGDLMHKRVVEINMLDAEDRAGKSARRIVKMASSDISRYSLTLKQQLPLYSEARREAFHALSNALALYEDFKDTESKNLNELDKGLGEILEAASGAKDGLAGFRNSLAGLPRLTGELNKAKRDAVTQLDRMIDEIDSTEATMHNILESIFKIKKS